MNLFELSSQYQALMDKVSKTDEISDELMNSLESVSDSFESKALKYASIVKMRQDKLRTVKLKIDMLTKIYNSLFKSILKIESTIKNEMQSCGKKKIENKYHEVKLIFNPPRVEYIDHNIIPDQYLRTRIKEIIEPDAISISKALKEGLKVPGAYLVRDIRVQIG